MSVVDLLFPVIGRRLPTDHAYPLYSAVSRLLPQLHAGGVPFGLAPITGEYAGDGQLLLDPSTSRLRLRIDVGNVPDALPLSGKQLSVMGQRLCVGVPQIRALLPATSLFSSTVTIKNAVEEDAFLTRAREQLDALGVKGQLDLPRFLLGKHRGEVRRSVIRIKDNAVICFGLLVRGLESEESLRLQATGIGGRRHMGAGLFMPVSQEGKE